MKEKEKETNYIHLVMIKSFDGLNAAADSGIHLLLLLRKENELHQKSLFPLQKKNENNKKKKKKAELPQWIKTNRNPKERVFLYKNIERETQKQRTQKSKITCKK